MKEKEIYPVLVKIGELFLNKNLKSYLNTLLSEEQCAHNSLVPTEPDISHVMVLVPALKQQVRERSFHISL